MVERHSARTRASGGNVGARAPGFVLPRANGGGIIVYEPRTHTEEGCVVLGFFPATRLESTHFLDWYACVDKVDVFVLSNLNNTNRHRASGPGERFAPALKDPNGHVAFAYGTTYGGSGGTVVLIDENGTVRHRWQGDLNPTTILEAVRRHSTVQQPERHRECQNE